jgi:hypothetical protein
MATAALVVVCALELLGRSVESFPPIRVVNAPPRHASPNAEAFVAEADPTIYLVASAPAIMAARDSLGSTFRCSDRAAVAIVASILVHEEWHLRHGHDENGAYQAQLLALRRLGFLPGSGPFQRAWLAWRAVSGGGPHASARVSP